eukprot:CAMPEP_0202695006 /NCGR_PEP_ID=MMETSP1385-20130828/8716_1 /ASSEMBLY_ACC=CAM_ASM_000861 /TAXON_ID=933848 /ORGANISM="Elphidium margaritaceum" /LENGTH=191 /DNA_ID=CAMNT_0049350959 /DNA_START=80 /DNA_END=655 /DNA_ORIENTATION=+
MPTDDHSMSCTSLSKFDDIDDVSKIPEHYLPTLVPRTANVTPRRALYCTLQYKERLIRQFAHYSYIRHAKILVQAYVRSVERDLLTQIPSDIASLCVRYHFSNDEAMMVLSHFIAAALKRANIDQVSKQMIDIIIGYYFETKAGCTIDHKQTQFYFNELIRLNYILLILINSSSNIGVSSCNGTITYYTLR